MVSQKRTHLGKDKPLFSSDNVGCYVDLYRLM
jgi:hypothetical protein